MINSFLSRRNSNAPLLHTGGRKSHEPTQNDQPSPKSSSTRNQLYSRLAKAYPSKEGFLRSGVANTNSMEPLLDDSDVVVTESLEGKWRGPRLKNQPLKEGDVVIYESNIGRIIHTLKSPTTFLGEPAWVIQGHNNFLPDMTKVPEDKIIARLVSINYGRSVRKND
jgi:hypothetical protein